MAHMNVYRHITRVKFNGSQKRYKPNKHYVSLLYCKYFIIGLSYKRFLDKKWLRYRPTITDESPIVMGQSKYKIHDISFSVV